MAQIFFLNQSSFHCVHEHQFDNVRTSCLNLSQLEKMFIFSETKQSHKYILNVFWASLLYYFKKKHNKQNIESISFF